MERNVDYVTIGDYTADMRELSDNAGAAIAAATRENAELKRMMWCLVRSLDGSALVPRSIMDAYIPGNMELWVGHRPDAHAIEIKARLATEGKPRQGGR